MNSGTVVAGTEGCTTITLGTRAMPATAVISRIKLKLSCVDRVVAPGHEQRIAVRRCAHDRLGAYIAAGSRSVLDDEWLAEALRQPLSHQARDGVGRTASGEWRDQTHWPR